MSTLGKKVRELRRAKGYTLRDLAEQATVPVSLIHNIESGYNRSPLLISLVKVAFALRTPYSILVDAWIEDANL